MNRAVGCLIALMAGLVGGCGGSDRAEADRPRHVLLISIDTLRPDHLGCYGYDRPTSPFLDELENQGVVFEQAYATSPWTLPSHATMLTGLYPSHHGAYAVRHMLPDEVPTLQQMLGAAGFQSAGVVNSIYLATHALDRGFGYFKYLKEDYAQRQPSDVTDEAIAWFDTQFVAQ